MQLRKEQFKVLDNHLKEIDKLQDDKNVHNGEEIEQVEYLQNENISIQKELIKNLDVKRGVLLDLENENFEFVVKFEAKADEKQALRN